MPKNLKNSMTNVFSSMAKGKHESIDAANKSKVFAGLMIITLNIASRFVTIKLSKSDLFLVFCEIFICYRIVMFEHLGNNSSTCIIHFYYLVNGLC